MELFAPTRHISTISKPSLNSSTLFSINNFSRPYHHRRRKFSRKPNRFHGYSLRYSINSEQTSPSKEYLYQGDDGDVIWGEDSDTIEVVGIGSRKDAILDFCLDSPFQSSFSSLRFWNIISNDSSAAVQLQQRSIGKDIVLRNMELPASDLSPPRIVILVASAGYGLDHITAIELLKAVKSADGLAVSIVLKPFNFEGQRRQDEVTELVIKLRKHSNLCIVVDPDSLLKKEVVTLEEALKSANNAVLLSINSIFVLMSESHTKLFDSPHNIKKSLEVPEILKLLECSEEASVGFGADNNMKSSIARAVFDCPFIAEGVKELNGVVFCTLACADVIEDSNLHNFLHTFRQITGWGKEIVLSVAREPNLEPNVFVTTIIVWGVKGENLPERSGFLSGLARSFPFVLSLLRKDHSEVKETLSKHPVEIPYALEGISSLDTGDMLSFNSLDDNSGYPDKLQRLPGSQYEENPSLSEWDSKDKISQAGNPSSSDNSDPDGYDLISEGEQPFEREPLIWWNVGPSFHIAEEWAKERAAITGSNPVADSQCIYTLPVGVKPSEQTVDNPKTSNMQSAKSRISNDMNWESPGSQNTPSLDTVTGVGFEAVMDIYKATSMMLKGTGASASKKPGLLSSRAASMLEVERDSHKKWAPVIEMHYRGGMYRGRCQGGLPEGKGRLCLVDGSIYDGVWRYGKKSGVGTFYFSNGDVFQGSWRDDLMHGKGWFYFHTGDRWFANFWKGKANGEGRFYSKDGEIFFGHFQDGWRHGHSLCITTHGVRWAEIWDEGILLSRQKLQS